MLPVIQSDACPLTGVVPVCPAGRWLEALRRATTIGTAASTPGMIRKLKSGEYRLYSRKKDASTGKRRNLGTFQTMEKAKDRKSVV